MTPEELRSAGLVYEVTGEVAVVLGPEVLDAVGQDQHPVRLEGVHGPLVVGDEHDGALVGTDLSLIHI